MPRMVCSLAAFVVLSFLTRAASADDGPQSACPKKCDTRTVPGVASYAKPSYSCRETGYYVGGGSLWRGLPGGSTGLGTWGWDYAGIIPKKVALTWSLKCQGGTGAYATDGPHLLKH